MGLQQPPGGPLAETARRTPRERLGWLALPGMVVVAFVYGSMASNQWLVVANTALLASIAMMALNLLLGHTGLVSIGNAAFLAVGGLLAAQVAAVNQGPMWLSLLIGSVGAGFVGFLLALPASRIKGLYLSMGTLAFHYIALTVVQKMQERQVGATGYQIRPGSLFGFQLSTVHRWFGFLVVMVVLVTVLVRALLVQKPGRAWRSIREQPSVAAMSGLMVMRYKVWAFVLSSALVGLSGVLTAYYIGSVSYESFPLHTAVLQLAYVIIGGMGSIYGPIVGAALLASLPQLVDAIREALGVPSTSSAVFFWQESVVGGVVVLMLLVEPLGLTELGRRFVRLVTGKNRRTTVESEGATVVAPVPAVEVPAVEVPGAAAAAPVMPATPAASGARAALLDVRDLDVRYPGGGRAVAGANLRVAAGEIVVVVGANGAGKTSMVRAVAGFLPREGVETSGSISLAGKEVRGLDPSKIARSGLCFVPERNKIFRGLTVDANLRLFTERRRSADGLEQDRERVFAEFPWIAERRDTLAGYLSGGQQQMLALTGVILARPDLLIIDEPSLGLAPVIVQQIMAMLNDIRNTLGIGILLVDQNLWSTVPIADRVYSMAVGHIAEEGKEQLLERASSVGYARRDEVLSKRGER